MPTFVPSAGSGAIPHVYSQRITPGDPWPVFFSDISIAAAHFAIVLVLLLVVFKRKDAVFRNVVLLFALFMGFRGMTQLLSIWTIWHPGYQLGGAFKVCTTVLSVATAAVMVWLLPMLRRMPSVLQMEKEIEERRRAEEASRDKEERFRNFVESVQDYAMFMIDLDGRVMTWNLGAERIKGYTEEEIVGEHFSRFYTEEDRSRGRPEEAIRTAAEAGIYRSEGWRVRKDGSRFWGNMVLRPLYAQDGTLRGFSKITRDLTQSRAMEAKYQTLLEVAPDAILIVDWEGKIAFANRRMEELFGYRNSELVGLPVDTLVPVSLAEGHRLHRESFHAFPHRREMGPGLDLMARRKDGSEFPVEISLSPLDGPEGPSVTAVIRDITERRLAAAQLTEKLDELHHSNEALEQFAHIASHDLQEPLRMVASYTQLLARRYKGRLDSDADEFIAYAVDGTQRMKRLIEDLLLYSRAGKGAPPVRQFQSEEALQEALNNLHRAIEESEALVTYDPLPALSAVESQLVQIFQNLIGNAIKYRGERVPQIHIAAQSNEREWIFSVADNGIGIDGRYFDRIFEIFQRLHGRHEYSGTGIGLAICKRILQQQGGRIWVESELGQGSVFQFALPVKG